MRLIAKQTVHHRVTKNSGNTTRAVAGLMGGEVCMAFPFSREPAAITRRQSDRFTSPFGTFASEPAEAPTWAGHYLRYLARLWRRDQAARNGLKDRPPVKLQTTSHPVTGSLVTRALRSSVEFLTKIVAAWDLKWAALGACLLLLMLGTGPSGLAQSSTGEEAVRFGVSNQRTRSGRWMKRPGFTSQPVIGWLEPSGR